MDWYGVLKQGIRRLLSWNSPPRQGLVFKSQRGNIEFQHQLSVRPIRHVARRRIHFQERYRDEALIPRIPQQNWERDARGKVHVLHRLVADSNWNEGRHSPSQIHWRLTPLPHGGPDHLEKLHALFRVQRLREVHLHDFWWRALQICFSHLQIEFVLRSIWRFGSRWITFELFLPQLWYVPALKESEFLWSDSKKRAVFVHSRLFLCAVANENLCLYLHHHQIWESFGDVEAAFWCIWFWNARRRHSVN